MFLYSKAAGFQPQIYQTETPPLTMMEFYWSDILHILSTPTPQNCQTHSNNSPAIADELF